MNWFRCTGGGGGGVNAPAFIDFQGCNLYATYQRTLTHTFAIPGKYQYYVVLKCGETAVTPSTATVYLNGTAITTQIYDGPNSSPLTYYVVMYGEIEANVGDILSVGCNASVYNGGMTFYVMCNTDISVFDFLGSAGNDGTTFTITLPTGGVALEIHHQGFYQWNCNFQYCLVYETSTSIPTPGGEGAYYWGGTCAMRVL